MVVRPLKGVDFVWLLFDKLYFQWITETVFSFFQELFYVAYALIFYMSAQVHTSYGASDIA